jgi:hypothetical protein
MVQGKAYLLYSFVPVQEIREREVPKLVDPRLDRCDEGVTMSNSTTISTHDLVWPCSLLIALFWRRVVTRPCRVKNRTRNTLIFITAVKARRGSSTVRSLLYITDARHSIPTDHYQLNYCTLV